MISCTEFIPVYNELFKFLHKKYGKKAVVDFWKYISDEFLKNLDKLVKEKGIGGMAEYWTHTLTEEGAEYTMSVGRDYFEIYMKKCPSVDILNRKGLRKYPFYCEHCDVLYRRVIEKYGFRYKIKFIDTQKGRCKLTVIPSKSRIEKKRKK